MAHASPFAKEKYMTPEAASIKAEALCNLAPDPVLVLDDVATRVPWPKRWWQVACLC